MSILITGATGYLGTKLTQLLAERGESVRLLLRKDSKLQILDRPEVSIVYGDIMDKESLENAMKGISKVYHMAAYARLWARDPLLYQNINVEGTRNVLDAALNAGIQKMVHTSTAGVVGPSGQFPMNEVLPREAGFFNSYEKTKWAAENLSMDYAVKGLQVTIVNPSRVYGPGLDTGSNPITKIVELFLQNKWHVIPGSGNDIGSYCYVDDVIEGHLLAMEKGRSGERYLFGGVNATFNQLMDSISRKSGLHKKLWHIPFPLILLYSKAQLWYAGVSGKPPMITPEWVKKYDYNWALDSSKAINELGYRVRPLDEGLQLTIEWVKKNRIS
jgi:nucleoside-diphosphate-sugar epimerase